MLGIAATQGIFAILLFIPGLFSWWLAPLYTAVFIAWVPRYMLMLHAVLHRPIFPKKYGWMNQIVPWVLGPLFGQTPTSFYVHHIGMHHVEDNQESDLSTTICYKRDSFLHWLHYWLRFYTVGLVHLYRYMLKTRRQKLARKLLVGEVSWLVGVTLLGLVNWQATLLVLVIPLLAIRVALMMGNWGQHAFVDITDPTNAYKHSTCLINHVYNHRCYNDGYHVVHHLFATMHWSEHPDWLENNLEQFARNDALIFSKLGNNQTVWWCLMTKQYGRLADHVVQLQGRNREETIAWLKSRTQGQLGRIKGILEFDSVSLKE
jgi:fatty acid desaturase